MSLLNAVISQSKDSLGFLENRKYVTNDKKTHYSLGLPQAQYNPCMYNRNGVTVFATMGNRESEQEQFMYMYHHNGNILDEVVSWGTYPDGNFHSPATVLILPDGRILTAASDIHNEFVSIKRSTSAYDLNTFTELVVLDFGLRPAYFTMTLIGTVIHATFRDQFERQYITKSTNYGETWSTPVKILELPTENWAYPRSVFSETEIILIVNVRDFSQSGEVYTNGFLVRSSDGVTFTNVDGTFSKDITVSHFTEAELVANCEIGTDIGRVSGGIQADDGTIWIHNFEYSTDKTFFWHSDGSGDFVQKTLTFDDYTNMNVSRLSMINTSGDNYTIFIGGTRDTDVYILLEVKTTDAFETFTVSEFKNPRSYNPVIAHNYPQTKQTPLVLLEQTYYDYGSMQEPFNSYSNLWFYY